MIRKSMFLCALVLAACGGGGDRDSLRAGGLVAQKRGEIAGPGACGIENAYMVTRAGGIGLSQPAMLTGEATATLDRWLRTRAIPTIGKRGGGLVGVTVASHYACRSRNSQPGARISEHAKGRAIDISAFILADGTRISVQDGWDGRDSRLLRRLHHSACGPFGTVLGPDSDRHHRDHFHFDVADYRSGAYCR